MKRRKFLRLGAAGAVGAALSGGVLTGCDSFLDPEVYSQLDPGTITTSEGMRAALGAAYGAAVAWGGAQFRIARMSDYTTDILWQTGGAENRTARPLMQFTWSSTLGYFDAPWNDRYEAVRNANIILDNLDRAEISDDLKALYRAEARFVRAWAYWDLYRLFGPVPLRTTSPRTGEQPIALPRASEEEMQAFLETELSAIIPDLPAPGQEPAYGRATNGAARGWLMRFYLNTRQWQKAADTAQDLIDMGAYALYPNYWEMFKAENERNTEYIWYETMSVEGPGNVMPDPTFPPGFAEHPRSGITFQPNWNNWASNFRIYDEFYHSFDPEDARREPMVVEYVNAAGETVNLLEDFEDNIRAFKYWPDPDAAGNLHGNDAPRIRYAAVLLARAEALNELQGPNQESIDLVNQVRSRAGLDGLSLGDFSSKEALREHIVIKERGWEFYYEGLRRDDLIRAGKFIELAQERLAREDDIPDTTVESYRQRFPIPQAAIDANPALEQNPGYGGA